MEDYAANATLQELRKILDEHLTARLNLAIELASAQTRIVELERELAESQSKD